MAGRVGLIALLCWQAVSTVRAHADFLAFFNELELCHKVRREAA
jgi:hypothetical protein